jgi:ParB-like chromosome segregation protein Spo0J
MALYFNRKAYEAKENSKVKKAEPRPKIKLKAKVPKPTKAPPQGGRDANHAAQEVAIKDIVILPNRRKIDREAVFAIAGSAEKPGELEPIIVRKETTGVLKPSTELVLVDGQHRIEAAKLLGRKKIEAVYFQGDKDAARLYELTQALARAGITVLDRAKFITEKVQLVLGKSRAKELERGGQQPGDKGVSKTARELGYLRDDIRRCMVIASMSEKAMAKAVTLDLDNNEAALLKIAKAEPDEQVALAEQLGLPRKKKQVKLTKKDKNTYKKLMDAWDDATEWQSAFREATENARRDFIRMLQKIQRQLAKGKDGWGTGKDTPDEDSDNLEDEQDGEDDDDKDHDGDEEDEEE